jgi:excisionase family DNA binding protein
MNDGILNLEQAAEFLGISEKTMFKLLREEHVPARKIGREWRFSREALTRWLASGDSVQYINQDERYMVYKDISCTASTLFDTVRGEVERLEKNGRQLKTLLPDLNKNISIPEETTLRVSYKQQREVEKLEFKIFWSLREECKMNQKKSPVKKSKV